MYDNQDYRTGKTTFRERDGISQVFCYECSTLFKSIRGDPIGHTLLNCPKCGAETSHEIPELVLDMIEEAESEEE